LNRTLVNVSVNVEKQQARTTERVSLATQIDPI
jgi:hypothetical protein